MTPHKANYGYGYDITTTNPTDTEAPMATIMVDSLTEVQCAVRMVEFSGLNLLRRLYSGTACAARG